MTISEYIAEAIKSGKTVKIKYVKYSGEISERTISDIKPSEEFGEGYISAFCHLRNETRTFKISRIREVDGIQAISLTAPTKKLVMLLNPHTHRGLLLQLSVRLAPQLLQNQVAHLHHISQVTFLLIITHHQV